MTLSAPEPISLSLLTKFYLEIFEASKQLWRFYSKLLHWKFCDLLRGVPCWECFCLIVWPAESIPPFRPKDLIIGFTDKGFLDIPYLTQTGWSKISDISYLVFILPPFLQSCEKAIAPGVLTIFGCKLIIFRQRVPSLLCFL